MKGGAPERGEERAWKGQDTVTTPPQHTVQERPAPPLPSAQAQLTHQLYVHACVIITYQHTPAVCMCALLLLISTHRLCACMHYYYLSAHTGCVHARVIITYQPGENKCLWVAQQGWCLEQDRQVCTPWPVTRETKQHLNKTPFFSVS